MRIEEIREYLFGFQQRTVVCRGRGEREEKQDSCARDLAHNLKVELCPHEMVT